MLVGIHVAVMLAAFSFMVLSFIPLGERRTSVRRSAEGESRSASQSYVVFYPWIAMGLFFILAVSALDLVTVECAASVDSVNTSVPNLSVYESSWTCTEHSHVDSGQAWLLSGLGLLMFAVSVLFTFIWSAKTLVESVETLQS